MNVRIGPLVSATGPLPRPTRRNLVFDVAVALVVGVVLSTTAAVRWGSARPSDPAELSTIQTLANAGAATLAPVAAATTTGLVALLLRRTDDRTHASRIPATSRRRAAPSSSPSMGHGYPARPWVRLPST